MVLSFLPEIFQTSSPPHLNKNKNKNQKNPKFQKVSSAKSRKDDFDDQFSICTQTHKSTTLDEDGVRGEGRCLS